MGAEEEIVQQVCPSLVGQPAAVARTRSLAVGTLRCHDHRNRVAIGERERLGKRIGARWVGNVPALERQACLGWTVAAIDVNPEPDRIDRGGQRRPAPRQEHECADACS